MSNPAELHPKEPGPPSGAAPADTPAPPRPPQTWIFLSLVLAGMLVGAIVVILLKSSGNDVAMAARAMPSATATVGARVETDVANVASRPKWSGGVQRSRGRNVAVYELEAENDVALWGKMVRPVLTVRCIPGTTEVFVLTQSAAAPDGNDGNDGTHTVRVGYDREADAAERWLASADYDALFAENGVGAARRIAAARSMRFGFTPYNGSPVVARFEVAGFNTLADKLAQTCRWK